MFGQTSNTATRNILQNNQNINRQPPGINRPTNAINPYRRRQIANNNVTRTNTNQNLPQNNTRTANNRNQTSIREIPNGENETEHDSHNPSPELSSDELSLPTFSHTSPNENREENRHTNLTTPSEHRNPTSRELLSILNNLPNTPDNRIARNRLLNLANNNNNSARINRAIQQDLPGLQGRHDFVRASELLTNEVNNTRQNNNNNDSSRVSFVTPQNHPTVLNNTTPEEIVTNVYTPKDKRLIPIREALESQPKAVRPILEKISSTVISLSNLIYEKHRTLEIWNNPTNNRIFENTEQNLDVLEEEFYVPNSLKLNNINLKLQYGILTSENYKEKVEQIQRNFEQAKNRFRISSSKCAKEIAELKLRSAIERRGQDIIKQFLLMLTHYVTYHRDKHPDIINTSKTDPVYAACILINFSSSLEQNFYLWAKINKETFLKMIVKELGESDEDLETIISIPLLETEKSFARKLEDEFLKKTFTQLTMEMATIYHNDKQSKEDNKSLTNIIKNNDLEKITAATREGLNNVNILESRETLENFLQQRDKVLERKLFSKFKQQQKQKNLHGPHKQNQKLKATPVGNANNQGSNSKNSSKQKRNFNSSLKYKQQTVTMRAHQKKRDTLNIQKLKNQNTNRKRRRENPGDMRNEKRRGPQRRRRR